MRLIFLSWAYPPMQFPRAVQVSRLARHLAIRPLDVFCAAGPDAWDAGDGVAVHRIVEPARTRLVKRLGLARLQIALAVPDASRGWAMRAARQIARDPLTPDDVLVTFGQPMSDHLAGLALTQRFGNRWIAHFSDPWADNPLAGRIPFFRVRNLGWERAVIAAADHLLVTSQETLDLVMRKYPPAWRAKASVLPHAFEPALYPPRVPAAGPLLLRYLGSLYAERSPLPFLRGLEILLRRMPALADRLRVEFIGEASPRHVADAARVPLPSGVIRFVPTIEYRASLAAMRAADLLIHIDAPADVSVFLASKLIDYLGARRPIIGVTPSGTAARLIAALGGWVVDPSAPERIATVLGDAISFVDINRDADWGDETIRRRYDIAVVARELAAIVDSVRSPTDPISARAVSAQDA